ncbi:MAG: prevent-host-death family protein [Bacteroidaceae bacterium]|nr:prevent-host-death family protein [Bacteroidaceae bacterium]
MTIVSTRDFRSNQTKYLGMVKRGERVILRSRMGSFHLTPVVEEAEPKRDITAEVCNALKDWRAYLDGDKTKMHSWEELMDELRD